MASLLGNCIVGLTQPWLWLWLHGDVELEDE
jgi:hypothetical protein